MKVAHILRKYERAEWGGTETALLGLCGGLRRAGVQTVAFAPPETQGMGEDPLARAGCDVRRFSATLPIWGLTAEQRRKRIAIGGNLVSLDLGWQLWKEPGLDAVHSHALGRLGAIGQWTARRLRVPFVVTLHGPVYNLPPSLAEGFRENGRAWDWGRGIGALLGSRRLLDTADAVLVGNREAAEVVRHHHPAQRVIVHPHGIDSAPFARDRREAALALLPRLRDRDVVLVVGRIDPAKNQLWLVDQMPALLRRHPRALLVLTGAVTDHDYLRRIEARIAELGLGDGVLLTGALAPADPCLVGLMQQARAMVLPSLAETFGLVILEAWAAGTPILAAHNPGAASLIEHCENGILFELHQPGDFHSGLDGIMGNAGFARRLTSAGTNRLQGYELSHLAARMVRLYQDLGRLRRRSVRRFALAAGETAASGRAAGAVSGLPGVAR